MPETDTSQERPLANAADTSQPSQNHQAAPHTADTRAAVTLQFANGPAAEAVLLTDAAPQTTQILRTALASPVTVTAVHAMYAGPEIMLDLPPEARTFNPRAIPAENQQVVPAPGDVIWYYQAPHSMSDSSEEIWEIGVFYGRGGRVLGPLGWTPCNIFATIRSLDDDFVQACANTRINGARSLSLTCVPR